MKKKTKILIAVLVILLPVLICLGIVLAARLGKKNAESESGAAEVWKEKPFVYENETEEVTYLSYKDAFAGAITALEGELEVSSEESGQTLEMLAAYADAEGTPTVIIAYGTLQNKVSFLVCKYKDEQFYKTYIETDSASLSETDDIILVENSDVIAVRIGGGEGAARQIIYDFTEGVYAAVKDREFESGNVTEMDEVLTSYLGTAAGCTSFYAVSVKDSLQAFLYDFAEIGKV